MEYIYIYLTRKNLVTWLYPAERETGKFNIYNGALLLRMHGRWVFGKQVAAQGAETMRASGSM